MSRKKRIKKGVRKLIIILIILFLITSLSFLFYKDVFHSNESKKNYNLKIDFEKTKIRIIDDKVKENIKTEKNKFIEYVRNKKLNNDLKFDFIYTGQTAKYQNVSFTHTTIYKFIGGNHYEREDRSYTYDIKNKKFLKITDFLNSDKDLEKLSNITKYYLNKYQFENNIEIDKSSFNIKEDSYKYFYFNKKGLIVSFVPYQTANWSTGEIEITLPFEKINDLLKDRYKNEDMIKTNKQKINPKTRDVSNLVNKKVIAFTFDDGPNSQTTNILLDNAEKYDARFTFFVLGNRISHNEDVLKKAYANGHEIGSHTYSHRDLKNLDLKSIQTEFNKTNKLIESVIGIEPIYLRPPYGSINDKVKSQVMMHTICWNVDSLDWKVKNKDKVKDNIVKNVKDGSIVLVHDIYEESVYGALEAMKELKKQGYNFVTITELAKLKRKTLDYTTTYYGF